MAFDFEKAYQALLGKVDNLTKDFEAEKVNNRELEAKLATINNALPDLASTIEEIARKNQLSDQTPWRAPKLEESNGYKEGSIRKENPEKLPFTGKKDCCPFCTEHGRSSLLDITKSGRWACRTCGKHWYSESLGEKYSRELEKYIRGDEGQEDPVKQFRRDKEKEEHGQEVAELKKELAELKTLLLKGALAPKAVDA